MEHSLKSLSQKVDFYNITINEFIEALNLIGFEVDNMFLNYRSLNNLNPEIKLVIKIPANRQDLAIEKNFSLELSILFLGKILSIWKSLKTNYFTIVRQKYRKYIKYNQFFIRSSFPSIIIYAVEIGNGRTYSTPLWIEKKLISSGKNPKKNIEDVFTLIQLEWGQSFSLVCKKNNETLTIEKINSESFLEGENSSIEHARLSDIVLTNGKNQILSRLSKNEIKNTKKKNLDAIFSLDIEDNLLIQTSFYDIRKNNLNLSINERNLNREFLTYFKFAFQRLLTILELTSSIYLTNKIFTSTYELPIVENSRIIKLELNLIKKFLNLTTIDSRVFEKIGLKIICKTKFEFYFTISEFRNDLFREIDLIEEYAKFIGYKNFAEIIPKNEITLKKNKTITYQKIKKEIQNFFIYNGFNQIVTNSISSSSTKNIIALKKNNSVYLKNPLTSELNSLRTDLISNVIKSFQLNLKGSSNEKNLFELGKTFKNIKNKIIEIERISFLFQVSNWKKNKTEFSNNAEWFLAKGFVESFFSSIGYKNVEIQKRKKEKNGKNYHPNNSIVFSYRKKTIGLFGQLSPRLKKQLSLKSNIYIAEFDLSFFTRAEKFVVSSYQDYSKYPKIKKDLSFSINKEANFYLIKVALYEKCKSLKVCEFFDIYFNNSRAKINDISIGIHLEFQSNFQTLTNEFVENELEKIREVLVNLFFAKFI